uniref:Uncharacterized protein n=1 Tax=Avena sativa TaxID=4498 RepID=A0ACD5WK59_AVESA
MDEDRARCHGGHLELGGPSGGRGADLISALTDDVIILVLVRLCSACAAVRTGILSRRWHGLWTRLPELIFRDVAPGSLLAALSSFRIRGVSPSLIDIHVPKLQDKVSPRAGPRSSLRRRQPANYVPSLLRAAARLSPSALCFNHPQYIDKPYINVDLSAYFGRATSIEVQAPYLFFPVLRFELPALQSLSLSGCGVGIAALVPLCPRLRVLRLAKAFLGDADIVVCSPLLEELIVDNTKSISSSTGRVHVEAPMLKRFTMFFRTRGDLSVSFSAPVLERASWWCLYSGATVGLGVWGLITARLETQDSDGQGEDMPRVHVLCLHMFAMHPINYRDKELGFATEINKHMITDFSGLEVYLTTTDHVFGAFLLRLLVINRIRTATRSLKIFLQRSEMKDRCTPLVNCSCDEPKDWRTQTISLTNLEKVEIIGFEGKDHEFDFLKLIFRCATMVRKVALELSEGFTPNDDQRTKIHSIFNAFPSVECSFDHSPGSMHVNPSCAPE